MAVIDLDIPFGYTVRTKALGKPHAEWLRTISTFKQTVPVYSSTQVDGQVTVADKETFPVIGGRIFVPGQVATTGVSIKNRRRASPKITDRAIGVEDLNGSAIGSVARGTGLVARNPFWLGDGAASGSRDEMGFIALANVHGEIHESTRNAAVQTAAELASYLAVIDGRMHSSYWEPVGLLGAYDGQDPSFGLAPASLKNSARFLIENHLWNQNPVRADQIPGLLSGDVDMVEWQFREVAVAASLALTIGLNEIAFWVREDQTGKLGGIVEAGNLGEQIRAARALLAKGDEADDAELVSSAIDLSNALAEGDQALHRVLQAKKPSDSGAVMSALEKMISRNGLMEETTHGGPSH